VSQLDYCHKLARIVWAVLASEEAYRAPLMAAA